MDDLRDFLRELKRRRVGRVAAVYAVVGWLVIQVAVATFPLLFLPEWLARAVVVLVLLGFPVALVLAWAFERTPTGLRRTDPEWDGAGSGDDGGAEPVGGGPAAAPGPPGAPSAAPTGSGPRSRRAVLALFGAGLLVAAGGYLAVAGFQGFPEGRADAIAAGDGGEAARVVRLDLSLGQLERPVEEDVVLSPDGSMLAVAARAPGEDGTALYVRRLSDPSFARIPGTGGAQTPAFSPDSRWIVYRDDGDLFRVAPDGGGGLTLFSDESVEAWNPHWGEDGTIAFTGPTGVHVIPPGGTATRLSGLGPSPFVLPDGSAVLNGSQEGVTITDVETDSTRVLVPGGLHPVLLHSGHLLYVGPDGGLFAQPFDAETRELSGTPVRVLDEVGFAFLRRGYSVAGNGSLVVLHGVAGVGAGPLRETRMLLVSRTGEADTVRLPPRPRIVPRFSPDGRFLAYEALTGTGSRSDVHTFDLVTGHEQPITFEGDNDDPVWSPDGERVLFRVETGSSGEDLYVKRIDDPQPKERVLEMPGDQTPLSWIAGDLVLFETESPETDEDLYWLRLGDDPEPVPFLQSPWEEDDGQLSPDGSLVAYESDETGEDEIWLRTFPDPTGKWRLSSGGGQEPRWDPGGRGVYFWEREADEEVLVFVPVEREPRVRPGKPEPVSTSTGGPAGSIRVPGGNAGWDVHPDGDRFLVTHEVGGGAEEEDEAGRPSRYHVVLNWFEELDGRLGERD